MVIDKLNKIILRKAIGELYSSILEELKQKIENPNLTDEQLNEIAIKIAEKGFYTKTEIDNLIANIVVPTRLSQLADDAEHRTVTDTEKEKWNKLSITVDKNFDNPSDNPISSKAVDDELDVMETETNNTFLRLANEFGTALKDKADKTELENYALKTEIDKKANKTELDLKVDKSSVDTELNVVTEITEENMNSEDPIATKLVTQAFLENDAMYERKEVSYFEEFGLVGLDKNKLNVITKGWNVESVQATNIDDIIINTSNLFKGDSKFAVYAR